MSNRRRRANDFTNSLRIFRQTLDAENIQPVSEMYSEDSLNITSAKSNTSIPLDSLDEKQNISSDSYQTAQETCEHSEPVCTYDETSYMSIDMNKCINLFHNNYLKKEQEITRTKTTAKVSSQEKVETTLPSVTMLSSESLVSSSKKGDQLFVEENQKHDLSSESSVEDFNFCELKTLLQSLESQQKSPKQASVENTFRRLSDMYYVSPDDFTERLLTIIEETVVTNESDMQDCPDVSLCRLTFELRKMCKFIDNETVPEWPASPGASMSICAGEGQSNLNLSKRSLFSSPNKVCTTTPIAGRRSGKSPRKISQRTAKTVSAALREIQSPAYDRSHMHDSTATFENLEAYCKRLFPNEDKLSSLQENRLQSPLQTMSSIMDTCESQMKSLTDSPSIHEKPLPVKKTPMSAKQRRRRSTFCEMMELDDLEKTIMYEIAMKRQRCLDTAKVIMEIDANLPSAAQETSPVSSIDETSFSTEKDTKLMETLMSCKKYKEYLVEYKPLLNLLRRSESSKSCSAQSKKNIHTKKTNVATLAVPKSSVLRGKNRTPSPKTSVVSKLVTKPRLFVTPTKTPVGKIVRKEKRTFFPSPLVQKNQEILKTDSKTFNNVSPSTLNIFRRMGLNYDSVKSPVAMYIRGTNPDLIKNLRPKTDETLLTPRRKEKPTSRCVNTKPKMKFRLSPKRPEEALRGTSTQSEVIQETNNFLHPKVCYIQPSHVRTIKETENRKVGNRINELLRSTQDKVVIRHEGRTKTVQTDCSEQPEIHYDSTEESVHIEKTARKTYFSSRVQKDS